MFMNINKLCYYYCGSSKGSCAAIFVTEFWALMIFVGSHACMFNVEQGTQCSAFAGCNVLLCILSCKDCLLLPSSGSEVNYIKKYQTFENLVGWGFLKRSLLKCETMLQSTS